MAKKKIMVAVDEDLHRQAKIKAAKTGIPMAVVMRDALEKWIKEEGTPPIEGG